MCLLIFTLCVYVLCFYTSRYRTMKYHTVSLNWLTRLSAIVILEFVLDMKLSCCLLCLFVDFSVMFF